MRYCRLLVAGAPRFGRSSDDPADDTIALLDGDPFAGPARPTGNEIPAASARFLVPCLPSKIIGVGSNYKQHAEEMGKPIPKEPLIFLKPPSAMVPHGAPIMRPPGYKRVDFEGELAAVIGRTARRVTEEEALSFVAGYTILNDVTVRDLQSSEVQFTRAKGFDSFAPVGPWIRTDLDPRDLRIRTRVNGVLRQDGATGDMAFGVAQLVSFASRVMTLEPGDLLSTGTPRGVGNLTPGDTVAIEIEGIGTLENPVIEALP